MIVLGKSLYALGIRTEILGEILLPAEPYYLPPKL
jgi:hypothetical protein